MASRSGEYPPLPDGLRHRHARPCRCVSGMAEMVPEAASGIRLRLVHPSAARTSPECLTVLGRCAEVRRKPGTDTEFPAQFAGNWLSVPGFARGICCPFRCAPKTVEHPRRRPPQPAVLDSEKCLRS